MNTRASRLAWLLIAAFTVILLNSMLGCSLVQTTVDLPIRAVKAVLPGGAETEPVDPIHLQEDLLRFANNFVVSTSVGAEKLQRDGQPINRSELLKIRLTLASDVYGLATGSSALANLVGLTVFASGARWRVEDYWLPKVYGISAQPILDALRFREQEIWALANRVLKPEMQAELHAAITQWRKKSGLPMGDLQAFASVSLVTEVTRNAREQKSSSLPSSVFALLDLDPLAGLDPATRELTETRLFAERALFIGQRMPQLIEWQLELLAMRTTSTPQITQLISDTTLIAAAGDRLSRTAEQLPALITSEREHLLATLKTERQGLGELSRNVGHTLTEGGKMADSTNQALKTFQSIVTQFEQHPSDPKAKPFEIKDYAVTAQEISRMSVRTTELLKTFLLILDPANLARLSAQTDALTRQTQQRSQEVVDYAFRKGLLLVVLTTLIALVSSLLHKWLGARIGAAQR